MCSWNHNVHWIYWKLKNDVVNHVITKNLSFYTIIHLFVITFLLPMYSYYLVVTIFVLKSIRIPITLFYTFFWWSETVFLESFVTFWLILCNLDKKSRGNGKIKWRHAFLKKFSYHYEDIYLASTSFYKKERCGSHCLP